MSDIVGEFSLYETYILGEECSRSADSLAEAHNTVMHKWGPTVTQHTCGLGRIYILPNDHALTLVATTIPDFRDQFCAAVLEFGVWYIMNTSGRYFNTAYRNETLARTESVIVNDRMRTQFIPFFEGITNVTVVD